VEIINDNISRNRKLNQVILTYPTTPKSYSASLLLREYYRGLDFDYGRENDWRYYFIVRRHYLRKVKRNGHWVCHYCGEPVYKMPKRNKTKQYIKNCITVDHVIPASQCDDILDTRNYVECCYRCNNDKGNLPYNVFKARLEKSRLRKAKQIKELSLVEV